MLLLLLVIHLMADMVVVHLMLELAVDLHLLGVVVAVEAAAHVELAKLAQLVHLALMEMMVMMVLPVMTAPQVLMLQLDLHHLKVTSALNVPHHLLDLPVMLDLKVLPVMLVPLDNLLDLPLLDNLDPLDLPALLVHPVDLDKLVLPDLLVPYKMFLALPDQLAHLDLLDNLVNLDKLEQAIPELLDHLAHLEMLAPLVPPAKLVLLAALEKLVHPEMAVDAITALLHVPLPVIRLSFYQICSGSFNIDCYFAFIVFVIYVQNGKII